MVPIQQTTQRDPNFDFRFSTFDFRLSTFDFQLDSAQIMPRSCPELILAWHSTMPGCTMPRRMQMVKGQIDDANYQIYLSTRAAAVFVLLSIHDNVKSPLPRPCPWVHLSCHIIPPPRYNHNVSWWRRSSQDYV